MAKAVFYDPQRRRWKHLRRVFDVAGILVTALIAFFIFTAFRTVPLPNLLLQDQRPRYHALKERERRRPVRKGRHRKTQQAPSQVVLNSDEGIRAAYYVTWDAGSFASLKENLHQIDLLYPEWLHVLTDDGHLQAVSADNRLYDVIAGGSIRTVDDKLMPFLKAENAETEVFPLVNNFDPISNQWIDTTKFFNDPQARANFLAQMDEFLASDKYRGLNIDFEAFPREAQPGYQELLNQLYNDLHARGMKLYVNVPARNDEFNYAWIAAHADGVILMDYDEHYPGGEIGPIASQDWFVTNLQMALKQVPKDKLICSIGNYGYDWATTTDKRGKVVASDVTGVTDQEAWLHAHESDADVDLHPDSLNPHYAYMEGDNDRHEVWFLDAVTALNQMRAANDLGIRTFALWRLGSEDPSLWSIWDQPRETNAPQKLENVPPGQDVDREGHGEILRIGHRPEAGTREISVDKDSGLIDDETFTKLPLPYEIDQYGASNNQIAITFDDGPDPHYTPKILDILKANQVHGTFFLIGLEAQKFPGLVSRIYEEGNEIGNHTFTHPDISNISKQYMRAVELNLTERFFAARLGVKPLFFRPPYSIDQEPDTADEVRPLELVQDDGYVTVGSKNDPNDWKPHRTAQQIVADVLDPAHLPPCDKSPDPQRCGNVVLLHDGGGDRDQTLIALPLIIQGLKARGFHIVPASALLGKTTAQVMPPISPNERWSARLDYFGFFLFSTMGAAISFIFIFGDFLMSARLFFVGALAVFDRFRTHLNGRKAGEAYAPAVAVLIPAYNEEKVIERTVRAVLASDYPKLRVIVIDDGSKDATLAVANNSFRKEIAAGRVVVLTKANGGKAEALNAGLEHVTEEIFVGIDADTIIAPDAIGRLVVHFTNPKLGAIAGNTKVGNRVNLWTRWQALEYITSQNFERRALNTLGAVSVVPGALGAWRTAVVRDVGAYHIDTVAEDADLTMSLLEAGYRVEYDDRALAYTEAPISANGLMRQRFRWSFGILQSVWKHRRTVLRGGTLGWVAIPNIVIFQILLPLVSPFIDIMFAFGALLYVYNRYFHPEAADPASFYRLVAFFAAFLLIDFFASAIAFGLERRDVGTKEDVMLLAQVWLQRFAYRQLFSIVLFKTLKRAIDGRQFSWDKLERTAAAALPPARSPASPAADRVLK